jgi:recombinational DNA repair protein RecR
MSKKNIDDIRQDLIDQLSKVSGLTEKEAKKELLQQLEHKLQKEIAQRLKQAEESIKLYRLCC